MEKEPVRLSAMDLLNLEEGELRSKLKDQGDEDLERLYRDFNALSFTRANANSFDGLFDSVSEPTEAEDRRFSQCAMAMRIIAERISPERIKDITTIKVPDKDIEEGSKENN